MQTEICKILNYFLLLNASTVICELIQDEKLLSSTSDFDNLVKCLLNVQDVSRNPVISTNITEPEHNNVIKLIATFHRNGIPHITTNDLETFTERDGNTGSLAIIFIRKCDDLTILEEAIIVDNFKYLIIMPDNAKGCGNLDKVGRKFGRNDVTFIIKNSQGHYVFIAYIPEIDELTCELTSNVSRSIINSCKEGFLEAKIVFPAKNPVNVKQCPLNVGVASNYPFAKVDRHKQNMNPVTDVQGSDVELIKIISGYLNSTLDWYYIWQEQDNPYMHTEFTQYLINGSLDICVGGLYRIYGDSVDYSGIYNSQVVTWMYYVRRESRTWQSLIRKMNSLYIFFSFYIAYSIIWFCISKFDKKSVSLTDTLVCSWGALLGASSLQNGRTKTQNLLNIVYLYMCIHLSAYISIQLFSFLTIQGPPRMLRTNEEVMESGRTPYLRPESKYFVDDIKYLTFASTSADCHSFRDCENKVLDKNGLTVIVDGYFLPFQMLTSVNDEARVMRATENMLTIYHEMVIRKDCPTALNVKMVLTRLFEAGICDRLVKEAIGLTVVNKAETAAKNIQGNSYQCLEGCSITLSQSAGAFYVWVFGCAVSCIVFVLELFLSERSG